MYTQTQQYTTHAAHILQQDGYAEQGTAQYFLLAFTQDKRILDIGAGSGLDLVALAIMGSDA